MREDLKNERIVLSLTMFRHLVGAFEEAEVDLWTIERDDVSVR